MEVIAATSILVTVALPLLLAVMGGGGVAFYMAVFMAKPQKRDLIVETTEKAVAILRETMDTQKAGQDAALQRITVLEGELRKAAEEAMACVQKCAEHEASARAHAKQRFHLEEVVDDLRGDVRKLRADITRRGGNPDG